MLVCNVSLRPPRGAIAATIAEAVTAADTTTLAGAIFAALVDDPAAVTDALDAYLGEIMVEAASASDTASVEVGAIDAAVDEPVTATDAPDATGGVYVANGVDFNEATPDYLSRATDLTGNVDSSTGVLSFWIRRDVSGTDDTVIANQAIPFRVRFLTTGTLGVTLVNNTSSQQLLFTSTAAFPASSNWRWFGISWNTNFAAGLKVIHVWNDAGIVAGTKNDTAAAFLIDYTRAGWAVAAQFGGSQSFDGCLSEVFFAPGQFIDFSVASNRAKFISDAGDYRRPVDLGADGSTPLGVVPLVYLKNPAASAGVNSGSGGDFTIVGAPAVASSPVRSPYVANAVDFSDPTDYLTRATDLAGNADSYTGTFSCWFRRDSQDLADTFIGSEGNTVRIRFQSANTLNFSFIGPGGETYQFTSTATYLTSATWRWIGASWNLNAAAGLKTIHVWNDAGIVAGTPVDASAAFMADYTRVGWGAASAMPVGTSPFNGALAELFFAPGQFIDLSVAGNRTKFIFGGRPVHLGADGSTPLGAVPLVYLKNPAATCNINSGSGGDFTIVGAPAEASSAP